MTDDDSPSARPYPERPCFHRKRSWKCGSGTTVWQVDPWYGIHAHGSPFDFWGLPETPISISDAPAAEWPDVLYQALSSVDPGGAVAEGLPFIGELEQTIAMIKRPHSFLKRLRVPRGMRHRPLAEVLRKLGLDKASSAWLQYQYGWNPLFSDLSAVTANCSSFGHQYEEYLNGSGGWRKLKKSAVFGQVSGETGDSSTKAVFSQSERYTVTLEYKILPAAATGYVLSYPNFLAKKVGMQAGIRSLASLAWELTPYSFVVDWFLPVGDVLRGTNSLPSNIEFRKLSHHHTYRNHTVHSQRPVQGTLGGRTSTGLTTHYEVDVEVYRRNWPDMFPEGSDFGLSTKRCISALSLIAQQLMRPIRK